MLFKLWGPWEVARRMVSSKGLGMVICSLSPANYFVNKKLSETWGPFWSLCIVGVYRDSVFKLMFWMDSDRIWTLVGSDCSANRELMAKASFRLQWFCCNQQLGQFNAINLKIFHLIEMHCISCWSQQNHCSLKEPLEIRLFDNKSFTNHFCLFVYAAVL